jgi:ribosomal-protein-alanine N-acetyltransferase
MYVNARAVVEREGAGGREMLLQVRGQPGGGEGLLELPGGRVEECEPILDALVREVREETGLAVTAVLDEPGRVVRSGKVLTVECLRPSFAYQTVAGPFDSLGFFFRCRAEGTLAERGDGAHGHRWVRLPDVARALADDPPPFDAITQAALAFYLREWPEARGRDGASPVRLDGPRITLRELVPDDWAAVHGWASRPEVCRYQVWGPNTADETRAHVERVLRAAGEQPRTEYTLAAELRDTGEVVGSGSLFLRGARSRTGEIAYVLHTDHWGRGLGTELARLLLRWGFEQHRLHRVFATCDPRNTASAGVLRKVGMTHEGRLRHTLLIRDGWRDSDVYALLEDEWRAGRRVATAGGDDGDSGHGGADR